MRKPQRNWNCPPCSPCHPISVHCWTGRETKVVLLGKCASGIWPGGLAGPRKQKWARHLGRLSPAATHEQMPCSSAIGSFFVSVRRMPSQPDPTKLFQCHKACVHVRDSQCVSPRLSAMPTAALWMTWKSVPPMEYWGPEALRSGPPLPQL